MFSQMSNQLTQNKTPHELATNYKQQKADFLDNLQPDDLRNAETFNQAEMIIDKLNEALYQAVINKKNPEEFIKKAMTNLFREDSPATIKAINLSNVYLKMKITDFSGFDFE
jgi:hypothetical protein